MLRVIIIDDERKSRLTLENFLNSYCEGVEIIGQATGISDGKAIIQEMKPDLVFLDIKLKLGTGFQILEELDQINFQVIFTTAYNEYAIKAFRFNALDYLLKPIDIEELATSVKRAQKQLESGRDQSNIVHAIKQFNEESPTLSISTETSYEFLKILDIVFLQADGAYTHIKMKKGNQYLSSKALKEFTILLSDYGFFRVHNSFLVNLSCISRFVKVEGGHLEMIDETQVPVSRRKKAALLEVLLG